MRKFSSGFDENYLNYLENEISHLRYFGSALLKKLQIFWCQHDKSFLDEFWSKHVFIKLSGKNLYEKKMFYPS